jgi:hypothetical protein
MSGLVDELVGHGRRAAAEIARSDKTQAYADALRVQADAFGKAQTQLEIEAVRVMVGAHAHREQA